MKNFTKFLGITILGLAFSANLFAQATATASASALATIVTPLTITNDEDLSFGNIAVSPTVAGTVTLTAAAATVRSVGGGCSMLTGNPGTVTAAAFTISGQASTTFNLVVPVSVSLTGIGPAMSATLTKDLTAPYSTDASGNATLYIGGTLSVAANQAAGNYSGTFNVSVNYN